MNKKIIIFSNRVKKFLDNPKAIIPFLIKKIYFAKIADNYIKHYNKNQFLNYTETLNYAIDNNLSIIRFGDELFDMLNGIGLYFNDWRQKYNKNLAKNIKEILLSKNKKILLCFNPELIFKSRNEFKNDGIENEWQYWINSKIYLKDYLKNELIYGSALCFNPNYNKNINYSKLKEYFSGKNIIIISSNVEKFKNIKLGLTTDFINAPKSDAWDSYNEIKRELIDTLNKNTLNRNNVLVLCSISTAGKVLCYEMSLQGITMWDTGQFFDLAYKEINKDVD